MESAGGDPFDSTGQQSLAARLPKIWIGYALAFATLLGEMYSIAENPALADGTGPIPLAVYLPVFVGVVYWLVCVHRYHVILSEVPGWVHPVTPNRAVWFHFIPVYNLFWVFKWPEAIAEFVNKRLASQQMKGWIVGAGFLVSLLFRLFLDASLGIIILFLTCTYVSFYLKKAFEVAGPRSAEQ